MSESSSLIPHPSSFTELARAKINLTLRVLGRRPDGYHEIESLVVFADIGDHVTLDTSHPPSVETTGPFAREIEGQNLAGTTLRLLAETDAGLRLGRVHIDKKLPVAAGLGGGSADAAAVLRSVRRANPGKSATVDWIAIAARLGADVPVCFAGTPCVMRGAGERLEPLRSLPRLDAVLVNPMVPVPARKTAEVFAMLDAPPLGPERRPSESPKETVRSRQALLDLMRRTGNDLTAAACEVLPDIVAVTTALEKTPGAELVQLAGAGPTCFAIFASSEAASSAALALSARHPGWWIEAAVIGA